LHNPVTFEMDVATTTTFSVDIGAVSGYGGAQIQVAIDGVLVIDEALADRPDPEDKTLLVDEHCGPRTVPLTPGPHTIRVENVGEDWFEATRYAIPRSLTPATPPVRIYGLMGKTQGLVWIQNRFHTWFRATGADYAPYLVQGAVLTLSEVPSGSWRIERWDTHAGRVIQTTTRAVENDGRLVLRLPDMEWDAAYRLHREP